MGFRLYAACMCGVRVDVNKDSELKAITLQ